MKKLVVTGGIVIAILFVIIWKVEDHSLETLEFDVTKEKTVLGVIMNGHVEDDSWTESHYIGLESIKEELNLQIIYCQNVAEDESAQDVIEGLIESGAKIIILTSFGFGDSIQKEAEKHPDVYFFHATGMMQGRNVITYFGRIYQMRYLTGIVAGLQTETNKIGYIASLPSSEVIRGINAFTLGVRSVNPEAVVYVEWTNSWFSDEAAYHVTEDILNKYSIDIITYHHNSFETLHVAEERNIDSIGYNMDHSQTYEKSFLTAAVWNWDIFYREQILKCLYGKFEGVDYWSGVDSGIIGLAPFTSNVKEGIAEIVEEKKKLLSDGSWDVFYGPILDQDGDIRVEEGASMTDHQILNEFNWFVQGVDGEIE